MDDALKGFDLFQVLFWIVPGTFLALFRSFAIRGSFPPLGKDDLATLILGSAVYALLLILLGLDLSVKDAWKQLSPFVWFLLLVVLPALLGLLLGLFEASDFIGRKLRSWGVVIPSPDATAWEGLFRALPRNAVLLVSLKDGADVFGRWVGGAVSSSASAEETRDLYLAETGAIDAAGNYTPHSPKRGAYIAADQIRCIEIIVV